ncbi:MAG: hypothetical protein KF828_06870, partial [Anaerolineales bacterium]|nr:hypothetical protein [Anaerolineales bacterium]
TPRFAEEMGEKLYAAARKRARKDPVLTEILQAQSYFNLYAHQAHMGNIDPQLEADASNWLTDALLLLEPDNA